MARWRNINTVVRDGDDGGGEDDGDKGLVHPSRTIPSNSTAGLPWRLQSRSLRVDVLSFS